MNTVKKIMNVFSGIVLGAFILLVLLLVGVRLFGIEPHIVLSGSMEPQIMTGSLAYVTRLSPEEACALKEGDTVTYLVDRRGTKVTHKIYEVVGPLYVKDQHGDYVLDENGERTVAKDDRGYPIIMYTTYGINNKNENDPSGYTLDGKRGEGNLASSNVVGKPLFSVPLLGYVAHFVQNPPGKYIALAFCIFLIVHTFLLGGDKKRTDEARPDADAACEENGNTAPGGGTDGAPRSPQ